MRELLRLFSCAPSARRKPGPKGPSAELFTAIIDLKRRNPRFGCVRIAQQIAHAFGVEIDKDVVRRILARHYRPGDAGSTDPSWLTFLARRGIACGASISSVANRSSCAVTGSWSSSTSLRDDWSVSA